jgi:hypothetical protein
MNYSDTELRDWWKSLSKMRQREILQTMIDKAWSPQTEKFAQDLMIQWDKGFGLTPRQIAAVKKWDR